MKPCVRTRGSAMPYVLGGMLLATLTATLAWTRAWGLHSRAQFQADAWQTQLLAESALACALDEMSQQGTARKDTLRSTFADTTSSTCGFEDFPRAHLEWEPASGDMLWDLQGTGTWTRHPSPLVRHLRARYSAAYDPDIFSPALSLWAACPIEALPLAMIRGKVRLPLSGTASPGIEAQKSGSILSFVPSQAVADTQVWKARRTQAFRSDEAMMGAIRWTSGSTLPKARETAITLGSLSLEGPWSGASWTPEENRTVYVEGSIEIRGKVVLRGWKLIATGKIDIGENAILKDAFLNSPVGVRISGKAHVQGQILAGDRVELAEQASLDAPSVLVVTGGGEHLRGGILTLTETARANGYLVAIGDSASVRLDEQTRLVGVVVSTGELDNQGRIDGVAVATRLSCTQAGASCGSSGRFDRTALPVDFAFPFGLDNQKGVRLISWELLP